MSNRPKTDSTGQMALSRRDLFLGAGMTAGAIAAIGSLAHAPAAEAALSKSRKYFASHVLMELDGISAGRVISAEGGEPFIVPATAVVGVEKTVSTPTLKYETLAVQLGEMSAALYDWIGKATAGSATPRAVNLITLNTDKEIYRLAMQNVRLAEVVLDDLKGSSQDPARFTVKMAPGTSVHQFGKGSAVALPNAKISPILQSNFRLYIQGVEAATTRAQSVGAVGLQITPSGTLVPMALKFSVPFGDAGPLFTWMQETLTGKSSTRPGELQLLSRDFTKTVASVGFTQLMIVRISCPAEAANGGLQHAEVECVPTAVSFNMGELLK